MPSNEEDSEESPRPVFLQDIKIDSDGQIMILARRVFLELLKRSSIMKISEMIRKKSIGFLDTPFDLQKCKILKQIGSGQFGKVFLAINQDKEYIAIKSIPITEGKDGKQKKWLKTIFEVTPDYFLCHIPVERKNYPGANRPRLHTVIHWVYADPHNYYMISEYINGLDFFNFLRELST